MEVMRLGKFEGEYHEAFAYRDSPETGQHGSRVENTAVRGPTRVFAHGTRVVGRAASRREQVCQCMSSAGIDALFNGSGGVAEIDGQRGPNLVLLIAICRDWANEVIYPGRDARGRKT